MKTLLLISMLAGILSADPNTKKINMVIQSQNEKVKIVKYEFNDFVDVLRYTLDSTVYDYHYQLTIYDAQIKKVYEIDVNRFFSVQDYTLVVNMAGIIKELAPMKPLFLSIYLQKG